MAAKDNKTDAVIVEHHVDVALVRLNRPRSRNALDPDIKAGLETAIPALMDDSAVRCLVITGSEDATEHKAPPGRKPVKDWDINFDPADENEGRMR